VRAAPERTKGPRMIELDRITVPEHVFGYPEVAFGGYVAGAPAGRSPGVTPRVDFRGPGPVGTPRSVTPTERGGPGLPDAPGPAPFGRPRSGTRTDGGSTALPDATGTVLTQAHPASLDLEAPACPEWDEVVAATERGLRSEKRLFTHCYGCGSGCAPGKGLRLFPCTLRERGLIVSAWTPDPGLAGSDGLLSVENVWAALDCPGAWAGFAYHR